MSGVLCPQHWLLTTPLQGWGPPSLRGSAHRHAPLCPHTINCGAATHCGTRSCARTWGVFTEQDSEVKADAEVGGLGATDAQTWSVGCGGQPGPTVLGSFAQGAQRMGRWGPHCHTDPEVVWGLCLQSGDGTGRSGAQETGPRGERLPSQAGRCRKVGRGPGSEEARVGTECRGEFAVEPLTPPGPALLRHGHLTREEQLLGAWRCSSLQAS